MPEVDTKQFSAELDAATQAHLEWSRRILRCAVLHTAPGEDVLKADAHLLCRFGLWFSLNRSRFTVMDAGRTLSLETEHWTMHEAIRAICRRLVDGRAGDAADLDAFEVAQRRFIDHLSHFKTLAVTQDAQIDALTGLPMRHRIDEDFAQLCSLARRHGGTPIVMLLDVDHFKQLNDRYGHAGGDAVLRNLAALMRKALRDIDKVYRYGGEEFLLLLDSDGIAGAQIAAQRMLLSVREMSVTLPSGESAGVTATIGVAMAAPGEALASVIERADNALYAGKGAGRDRWVIDQRA